MTSSPIALFVYNRPWHTRQTVEALRKNELAGKSSLFIFSDAAKTPSAVPAVQEVRNYIKSIVGFKSIDIIERAENLGLANSVIDGVTRLSNAYGRVVVLEDDMLTSRHFLRFMNEALELYEQDEKVISIQGYWFPIKEDLPETFFMRGADCWGWATWKRGWDLFEADGKKLLESLKDNHLENEFNFDGRYDYLGMLEDQVKRKNDSWAIRWYASAFLKNKLALYPGKTLVLNIGTDGSGVHCGTTNVFSGEIAQKPVTVGGIPVVGNAQARAAVVRYFEANRLLRIRRAIKKIVPAGKNWFRWGARN